MIKLFGNVWIVLGLAAGATLFVPQIRERQSPQTRSQQACVSAALLSAGMAFTRRPTEGKK